MFDGSIPVSGQDVKFHISLVTIIHKGDGEVLGVLVFCTARYHRDYKPIRACEEMMRSLLGFISVLNSRECK
ncbi:hypothetical protein Ddye_019942 [Dipteronia dyeriana]|uniref:Uncharacterized protein n=1 Tax=Dipteronia dyeriana TaxID=168575 RepID=A0AAD9WW77_9ROSI|nr:hypothetical protein Ddye_019942 [Dipteronia dyeriana]